MKQGNLSINSENIFPIIKKWLYSDHDVFIRELVSNASDAIMKLKKLELIGEAVNEEKYEIKVCISPKNKTVTFIDNGIGMSEGEVEEYINQIAFSGAKDFVEKYKDKASEDNIIGHFGLGFYSAFMVADKVTIKTKSYRGDKAVYWESDGGSEYKIDDCDKITRGTEITLYLNDNSYEFSNIYKVREVLNKYCSFMPIEIYLIDSDEEKKEDEKDTEISCINDINPLWNKHPNECSDEDYKNFYKKVFNDYKEPLFWIHLNMDYPFNLKGILYFPKVNIEYEAAEGVIKLYNNQVFIADNIKEVIPEFLMLLKGVIDCPDIPLNVSRSALLNDGFVKKISDYIIKKVADKLSGLCKTDRENYEKYWDDISPFIKYGCLRDEKFADKIADYTLIKDIEDKYYSFKELLEKLGYKFDNKEVKADNKGEDAEESKINIVYISDLKEQDSYIRMYKDDKKEAYYLSGKVDAPFINFLEMRYKGINFIRIDSNIDDMVVDKLSEEDYKDVVTKISDILNEKGLKIEFTKLNKEDVASIIGVSEQTRRMQDMFKQYGMKDMDMGMDGSTLYLNTSNKVVDKLLKLDSGSEEFNLIVQHLYDLACISNGSIKADRVGEMMKRSLLLLDKI